MDACAINRRYTKQGGFLTPSPSDNPHQESLRDRNFRNPLALKPPRSYGEVALGAVSPRFKTIVQLAICSSQLGFACVNLTFVAQQLCDVVGWSQARK